MSYDDLLQQLAGDYQANERPSTSGSTLITNDPTLTSTTGETVRLAPKVSSIAPTNTSSYRGGAQVQTDLTSKIFAGIETQLPAISQESDPFKRASALSSLKGSMAEASAMIIKETSAVAERDSGVPQLMQALDRSVQMDKAHPFYYQHLVDSKETTSIRLQLDKARQRASLLTDKMIRENPTINGMTARLDNFVKIQESLINKDLTREERKQDYIDQEMLSLGVETPKFLTYIMPEVANDPRKAAEVKLSVRTDPNKKELAPFFSPDFSEEQIVPLSFMGNKPAQQMAIKVQADRTGESVENIRKNLTNANAFVNNEGFFLDQMKQLGGVDPSFREAMNNYSKLSLSSGTSSAGQKQKFLARLDLVDAWTRKQATLKALGNVESWNGDISLRSSPGIAASIDKLKTLKPNTDISMEALIGDYVSGADNKDKAARMDEIKAAMTSAVEKNNKGLYGKVDLITMNQRLKASTAFSSLQLGAMMDSFGNTMAKYVNTNPGSMGMGVR